MAINLVWMMITRLQIARLCACSEWNPQYTVCKVDLNVLCMKPDSVWPQNNILKKSNLNWHSDRCTNPNPNPRLNFQDFLLTIHRLVSCTEHLDQRHINVEKTKAGFIPCFDTQLINNNTATRKWTKRWIDKTYTKIIYY